MSVVRYFILILLFTWHGLTAQDVSKYVDPFIGTGGHGHTFPGATVPFGMVQLSPDTRVDGSWDGCSGYHYSDTFIYGFSHTHLSGTGVSDYGDVLLMPMAGKPLLDSKDYGSGFSHDDEKASAGYYSVLLKKSGIKAELTASTRVGMHKYSFPKTGLNSVILDLQHRDQLTGFEIKIVNKKRIEGYRKSSAWAEKQELYFVIEFSQAMVKSEFNADRSKAGFTFLIKNQEPLLAKVSLSFCNQTGASENMFSEIPGWDFDSVRIQATALWDKELGKIMIQSSNPSELTKFYTALYHCMIHPNMATDVNRNYRGMDGQIHRAEGYDHYTVFSLWDTYRALHPLLTIIDRKRTLDFIQTFLSMYRDGGRLPVWELAANETNCMIGYHCASVIADAWSKGIRGFDSALALEAMMSIAEENRFGKNDYRIHGFISAENEPESVSKTLEYAYDDWCISSFADAIGKKDIAEKYRLRSNHWYNLFDPRSNFMRPRYNGDWLEPFDPLEVNNHFTEANSWQYSFYVKHDIRDFIELNDGISETGQKLDALFAEKRRTTGREQADITGLIGQYAHGNEPSHHIVYLYNYIYQPEKTQNLVHAICRDFYTIKPDGLIGNEDCGQMSAWYVMSALGFYQVCPGFPWYTLGTPALDKADIYLENGNVLQIGTKGRNDRSWFAVPIFRKEISMFLHHDSLMTGGELAFELSPEPSEASQDYLMLPLDREAINIPAPPLVRVPRSFRNTTEVSIATTEPGLTVYYYLNSDSLNPKYYTGPFSISSSAAIHAFAVKYAGVESLRSPESVAHAYKMPVNYTVDLKSEYNRQYSGGGPDALINGIRGTTNWRAGDWQGYQAQDFEVIIDLGSMQPVSAVSAGFLQDTRSWILMPTKMEVFLSTDGSSFVSAGTIANSMSPNDETVKIQDLKFTMKTPRKSRYVKIKATNFGKLPPGHPGHPFDGDAFIFVDEINIR